MSIPSYVEVNFNNVCNPACSYCSPSLAVRGQKKQTNLAHGQPTPHNDPAHFTGSPSKHSQQRTQPTEKHFGVGGLIYTKIPKHFP